MPKMKTHSGAKKRFKVTGGGKILKNSAYRSHILGKKSPKRKRRLRKPEEIHSGDSKRVRKLLPYK